MEIRYDPALDAELAYRRQRVADSRRGATTRAPRTRRAWLRRG
jgi:hypothetical protein